MHEKLITLLNDHHLTQLQKEPTRECNVLDLYYTNKPSLTKFISVIPGISDHDIALVDSDIKPKLAKKEKQKVYLFNKADWGKIREKTSAFTTHFLNKITQNTVEHNWQLIKKHISQTISNLVPCKTTSCRYNLSWVKHLSSGECAVKSRDYITRLEKVAKVRTGVLLEKWRSRYKIPEHCTLWLRQ